MKTWERGGGCSGPRVEVAQVGVSGKRCRRNPCGFFDWTHSSQIANILLTAVVPVGSLFVAESFFDEQAEQSKVKSRIVAKYFLSWAKVITGYQKRSREKPKIGYVDLFAGPGRYKNGAKSTPLFILETAIQEEVLRNALVTVFNDKDATNTSSLVEEIEKLEGVDQLTYEPQVDTEEIGENIVKRFETMNLIPSLFFIDPWGYKGLSLRLINSVLKDWACECIFFFNYTRINMGLSNESVREHMEALFGRERAEKLTAELENVNPHERELTIVERLCEALIEMGGKYVLPFGFKNELGNRTKHHLVFVSKHPLGYKIMKHVMFSESSLKEQGVATFEYSPASKNQPMLFELARPLDDLEEMLLDEFAGKTMRVGDIVESHNYGRCYIDKNYKDVLMKMEASGKVTAKPGYKTRKKNTCADHVVVTFPKTKELGET